MMLERVLQGVVITKLVHKEPLLGPHALSAEVSGIHHDSRAIRPGMVYIAIRGARNDGQRFIPEALEKGAVAVVMEDDGTHGDPLVTHAHAIKVVVPSARAAMARMARNLYEAPSERLSLIGVTGTNGKTTTTHLVRSIFEAHGQKAGLIGTMGHHDGLHEVETLHTTPESPEINRLLSVMVGNGCSAAAMEVSSHALVMQRVEGLRFAGAVFTNLTQDHLDFHGSMDRYFHAKKILFDSLGPDSVAVTNIDDPRGAAIAAGTPARLVRFGKNPGAEVRTTRVSGSMTGTTVVVEYGGEDVTLSSPLVGLFNAENLTAAFAATTALGVSVESALEGIAGLKSVRGRFEAIRGRGWTAVVDYAHTPDALERALSSLRMLLPEAGRIIAVFGCGGDRDRGKRPLMGEIAGRLSDTTIVTSDNPRSEDPVRIMDDVLAGMRRAKSKVFREADRREAIRKGLGMAGPGDAILIAGKGHETYQIIGDERTVLDDREEVRAFLNASE